ncbi:hypothetical protein COB52_00280 [Candidatus Kaiserbacteria bacterium]|nr:MAG: hypothetical protein COB52_00280 [Candidatus Kaiserbacteria bacterium]
MSDVIVNNKKLISTTKAAESSGYSKDYIGQLCRNSKIECRQVSGHWYVNSDSLDAYKGTNDSDKSEVKSSDVSTTDEGVIRDDTITHDGDEYISTSRAAELTGYTQDYIGQMARSGEVAAHRMGRRWFVGNDSLLNHKKHNDNLLAAVQSQASGVGLVKESAPIKVEKTPELEKVDINFNVKYVSETDHQLVPNMRLGEKDSLNGIYAQSDIIDSRINEIPTETPKTDFEGPSEEMVKMPKITPMPSVNVSRNAENVDGIGLKKQVVFTPPPKVARKHGASSRSLVIVALVLMVGGYGVYSFVFGEIVAVSNVFGAAVDFLIPADLLPGLQEKFGEFFPGTKFRYVAS